MMCARSCCKPHERTRARPALPRPASASSTGCSRGYERSLALGAAPSARSTLLRDARDRSRSTSTSTSIVPKGFFPQQDTGRLIGHDPGRPGHVVPGDAAEARRASSTSSRDDPAVETVVGVHRRRQRRDATPARMFVALKPLDERERQRRRGDRAAAPASSRTVPGRDAVPAAVQDSASAAAPSSAQYQYTLQGDDLDELNDVGAADARDSCAAMPRLADVNSDQQNRGPARRRSTIDRDTAVAARHHAADDRRHALRRLRPAAGLDDVHAAEPVPRRDGGRRRSSGRAPRRCSTSTCARRTARRCRSRAFTQLRADDDAARVNHSGPVSRR